MKKRYVVLFIVVICIVLGVLIFNKDDILREINYKITYNNKYRILNKDIDNKDCKKDKDDIICEVNLGTMKYSEHSEIRVTLKKVINDKEENYLYFNDELVDIPKTYELIYLEPILYKNEIYSNFLFFMKINDNGNYKTLLVNPYGKVQKELTINYYNDQYDIELLEDGNVYIFYNTCENNVLTRYKQNITNISKDKVSVYSEKVVSCS